MINQELLQKIRNKIKDLPHENYWNVSPEIGTFLANITETNQAKIVLEIGTSSGYSGTWFAQALDKTQGHLYTIESHTKRYALAQNHFKEAKLEGVITQLKGHAPEIFLDNFPKIKVDIAFLDATKGEYGSYVRALKPILQPNGLIIADNVTSHYESLHDFFTAIKDAGLKSYYAPDFGTGLIIAGKEHNKELYEQLSGHKWQSFS